MAKDILWSFFNNGDTEDISQLVNINHKSKDWHKMLLYWTKWPFRLRHLSQCKDLHYVSCDIIYDINPEIILGKKV